MPTRFTKPKIPTESRPDLMGWILNATKDMSHEEAMCYLMAYFTLVDLELIKQDIIARKKLTTFE